MASIPFTGIMSNSSVTSGELQYSAGLLGVKQSLDELCSRITACLLAVAILFALAVRLGNRLQRQVRHAIVVSNPLKQKYWELNATSWLPWLKVNLLYAPIWKLRCREEIQLSARISLGSLPSRGMFILLLIYGLTNVTYGLILPYQSERKVIWVNVRARCGTLAMLNMLPTVIFATRNNPLIWLLGVSFDTFNILHRWMGRLVIVEAIGHTIAWLLVAIEENNIDGSAAPNFSSKATHFAGFSWGMVATCAFSAISVQSWSPVRRAYYEIFLIGHKALALLALTGAHFHLFLEHLPQLPWMKVLWTTLAIEYAIRAYIVIYHNWSPGKGWSIVTIKALGSEACQVTFQIRRPWKARPGSHAYIYLPTISGISSHPFSIAWQGSSSPTLNNKDVEMLASPLSHNPEGYHSHTASFIVRARTGMTYAIYQKACEQQGGVYTTFGALEGPYGGHVSLRSYGTVILFAGGVGITYQLAHMRDLVIGYKNGTAAIQRIILVWVVRNTQSLAWVLPWIKGLIRDCSVLDVRVFMSRPSNPSGLATINIYSGRCDADKIVQQAMQHRVGAVAVTLCGPGAFADQVRKAVRKQGQAGVLDFIEETFSY
jgi:predicted ferric reductase